MKRNNFRKMQMHLSMILFLLMVFTGERLAAQARGAQYKGADDTMRDVILYDTKGQPIPINDHSNIGGTPYLQSDWTFGTIILSDGRSITDSMVNYSLYNDHLYFRRDNHVYEISYPIRGFSIRNRREASDKLMFRFQNGFPAAGKNDSTTFYEILASGDNIQLLKREVKRVRETYNYGGAYQSDYTSVYEYFIFYPDKREMQSLGSKFNVKKLDKDLPQFKDKIDEYASANNTDVKNETDLTFLVISLGSQANK